MACHLLHVRASFSSPWSAACRIGPTRRFVVFNPRAECTTMLAVVGALVQLSNVSKRHLTLDIESLTDHGLLSARQQHRSCGRNMMPLDAISRSVEW